MFASSLYQYHCLENCGVCLPVHVDATIEKGEDVVKVGLFVMVTNALDELLAM